MIHYEVNLEVQSSIASEYETWLGPHIQQVLASPGFVSAEWWQVEDPGPGTVKWSVRYAVRDRAALEDYFAHHAPRLREDGVRRFGDKFKAVRRILTHPRTFARSTT